MKIEIINHVFNIPERLREIERDYFVVYDTLADKYEVHSKANIGNTYCLTIPYDQLDARTIEYVRKTRKENADTLFKEMERDNEKLLLSRQREFANLNEGIAKDIYRYSSNPIYSYKGDD